MGQMQKNAYITLSPNEILFLTFGVMARGTATMATGKTEGGTMN